MNESTGDEELPAPAEQARRTETVITAGEDFTDFAPLARTLFERIGAETKLTQWQINFVLREAARTVPGLLQLIQQHKES